MTDQDTDCWAVPPLRPTISFEVMPPRRPGLAPKFWGTVDALIGARPDFLSVTYGAAGNDRDTARQVVSRLVQQAPVLPIAHLTCVGHSRADVVDVVDEFLSAGVRSFLALRGDPPAGQPDWKPTPGGVNSSVELIALLKDRERTRCAAHPGNALRGAAHPLTIAVATFPDGNPAAGTTRDQEIERLLVKQAAGASFAITQLFYRARTYAEFVERARAAGVHIPILAGILPATDPTRLLRVAELSGVRPPAELLDRLSAASSDDERHAIGTQATAALAQSVLDAGAPGLHIYTFNKARPALDVLAHLELLNVEPNQPNPLTASAVVKGTPA
ncbi:methylenetetrahydrofolate reductase [Rarobacter incanus]|uniref:Methylenetetrahydrofolate reductase n=1 Tax=Rarobacter incanus TaxID=153494 RepID=A0A542SPR4_9MICO|nr:methylenetetrahydrofolate reductase [Rarobacter incanus]TQK76614.1 methylenetetrahydrofolate reductase (NADPH) [Rarobacter incanus]